MQIEIELFADHPGAIPTLASWLYDEWSHRSPDGSPGGMEAILKSRLNRDRLPLALIALADGQPAGTVSLKIREIETLPKYESWLGALYVHPDFRRKGIGAQLLQAAEETARSLGIETLYLYTRHASTEDFYARLGWARLEEMIYSGNSAIVMGKSLVSNGENFLVTN
jgi:GNAT superfamily N-acetyltransferase